MIVKELIGQIQDLPDDTPIFLGGVRDKEPLEGTVRDYVGGDKVYLTLLTAKTAEEHSEWLVRVEAARENGCGCGGNCRCGG